MNQSFSSRVAVAPDVLFRIVGEETVLLNLNTETYLGLDSVGTRMWNTLTQAGSIEAAYDLLLKEYEVEPEQLRLDLQEFLGKLLEHGLIQLHPEEMTATSSS